MTAAPFRGGSIGDALRHRILADRTLRRTPVSLNTWRDLPEILQDNLSEVQGELCTTAGG